MKISLFISRIKNLIRTSIGKNVFSTFFGVGIQLFTQIVLVPFYIVCWGNELYSDWIVLSAITVFFSVSDIGLTTISVNRFSLSYAGKNYDECNALLANSTMLLICAFSLSIILSLLVLSFFDIVSLVGLHNLSRFEASVIIILFIVKIFMGMMGAVYNSIYRAASMASRGIMAVNVSRLLECLSMIVCLLVKIPILITAVFFILPSCCLYIFMRIDATKRIYQYRFKLDYLNWPLFKSLIVPSVSFMAFPLSQSLNTQGMTIIINSLFGAEIVVLYNTTRTLSNFAKLVITNLHNAIWPEFTVAFAHNNTARIQKITRNTFRLSLVLVIIMSCGLLLFGEWIFKIWTRGRIAFSLGLMSVLMFLVLLDTIWSTARMALNATNRHLKMSPLLLVMTVFALLLAYSVGRLEQGIIAVVGCLAIIDLVMAPTTIKQCLSLTKDRFINWLI